MGFLLVIPQSMLVFGSIGILGILGILGLVVLLIMIKPVIEQSARTLHPFLRYA